MLVLVTGGARSGKSSFAETYTAKLGNRGIYIATAQAYDDEMRARIGLHRLQREETGFEWATHEEPLLLTEALLSFTNKNNEDKEIDEAVILVDCLTLWLSNCLLKAEQQPDMEQILLAKLDELTAVCQSVASQGRHLILVTNEVGYGLVPEYKLGRQFRDLSGTMNRILANVADQVFLVTSGIPVELTSLRYKL
ncbi:adenosylcobinamide kinase /adenosylcobinamide-phosphate guanylyltransferase [Paenibacillus sp. 1_12]|uniref:bifunctional adenosylcobinamide kinase/adenosylcobinamide-phosphate guanylyltransferase n=1 Tax=Paenibacillus sp. 1_12 TaxID=1566278 RepID=UPI0008EC310E|nr:bifunctional adenosylcobinamide kinase/adenosylcobinamide-phosphate guanylyltransferase [Paenibacillus sp. 1_12]SFL13567.1 adenosylcobinamide kinase /adenosylcobinamide-phosphate guanylyltransferase [Paenibacillus sp. 1_12]